ncbi:MAG: mechanosensitive ion channel protein MscS [Bacteroidetes bacterium MedPE-SWsnd-G2]|nr:MAG: mechanosensitive ion channel protein MscS [Bacteroidetes bacterium MedPE-SWsnd-G2]
MELSLMQSPAIQSLILVIVFLVIRFIVAKLISKIGNQKGIYIGRTQIITRYISFFIFGIALLIELYILGANFQNLIVVFSSIFAVIGIGLFAVWSILSNITAGVLMFFSFPYKIGDKIEIHDKDFPIIGIIEDIRAFQLLLRLENGNLVTYPNNLVMQKAITLVKKDAIISEDQKD